MAVKLEFDHANVVNPPTIVLAKKSGKTLGTIPAASIHFEDCFNSKNTITFKVNNENNGVKTRLWNQIKNFKLIWCKEWDAWFEITVEIDESNKLVKNVEGHSIGESELSAIKLFNIQINTEEDIALDDYVPTVLYDGLNSKASLLDRIMEKAPHYSIKHVDSSIASIQRTFTFDNTSILDAFNEIGEEIGCIFILSQSSGSGRFPERGIYVYDLMNYCETCGYREEGISVCPECGGTNIQNGYGLDTNVFISNENIAKEITLTTDTSSVNNCFRLETGDDLMTATVASCNPNGTEYLWYITEETKSDMSDELAQKLSQYDALYSYYRDTYQTNISSTRISNYNTLVTKYSSYNSDLQEVANTTGFSNLINIIYNAIDFELFLTSGLMPSVVISDTTASQQAALLTASSLSPIAVANMSGISKASVDANVLAFAKSIVRSTYRVDIKSSSFNSSNNQWIGIFTVENYSDEEDVADSSSITITINDNYERYVKQKIDKLLSKNNDDSYDVVGLFNKTLTVSGNTYSGDFANEIKKYALNPLKSFHENCQSCIDILSEEGISDATNWLNSSPNLYQQFYKDYRNKLKAIEAEMKLRQTEINTIKKISDSANKTRDSIQTALDFKAYIGTTLWKEFCSYRRETSYSNNNYVSDGLSNAELLNRAREFIAVAQKELVKSATLQHSIESTLNNLLVIKEFEPILNSFKVGNWIRVRIDGQIYKLRLISYSIDFDELDELSVEFSDVVNCGNDISDLQSVLNQASSMATSYQCVERQAGKGNETTKTVKSWFTNGLNATLTRVMNDAENQNMTFDNHGLLMRKLDDVSGNYYDEQLRIINSTILITDDNWETTKTAIGKFYYIDPSTGNLKQGYGINGETIVGKLIIGQSLALYNSGNTMKFDANGLNITNGTNTFIVNPSVTNLLKITKTANNVTSDLLYVDSSGDLFVKGAITATTLSTGGRTSSATGINGAYIDSSGNIYAGSSNQTIIYANGNLNLGNGKLVYNGTSLTVNGAITATTLSTGGRTSSATGTAGIFINSSGNLYAGSDNDTIIYANGTVKLKGSVTATTFKAIGTDENTYCTIGDRLYYKHKETGTATEFARFVEYDETIGGTDRYYVLSIWGDHLTFSWTNNGSVMLYYSGSNTLAVSNSLTIDNKLTVMGASNFYSTSWFYASLVTTSYYYTENGLRYVHGYNEDNSVISCNMIGISQTTSGLYIGEASGTSYTTGTFIRGSNVRLFAHSGGGVYLGESGSTAITSDESLKDIYDIDERYVDFFNSLNPVLYKYKCGHRTHIGFGAQSVEKALLSAKLTTEDFAGVLINNDVTIGEDEKLSPDGRTHFDKLYSLRYEEFISLNTMMIKKLQGEIKSLKDEIAMLKSA